MLCDNCKMCTAKNWILIAQIRVVKGASSSGNQKKTIMRKGVGKCMNTREEKLEPSRNKVGQNRDLQAGIQSRVMKSTKSTKKRDARALWRRKTTQRRIWKWHFHTQVYAITISILY